MTENNLIRKSFSIIFDSIECYDNVAFVTVIETIIFDQEGIEVAENVPHQLHLYLISNHIPEVAMDAYYESTSGFSSCSYVPDSTQPLIAPGTGSALCIIQVALNEVGYVEEGDKITKYGSWAGMNGYDWCGTFVSWCAGEANIPTAVIRKTASLYHLREDCQNHGSVHNSIANGGDYTPQPGDLFFTIGEDGGLGHVGIVESVDGQVMWCIEGNWGHQVVRQARNIRCSELVCFGTPGYLSANHSYSYDYTGDRHWLVCNNCGQTGPKAYHHFVQESPGEYYVCTICGFRSTHSILLGNDLHTLKE